MYYTLQPRCVFGGLDCTTQTARLQLFALHCKRCFANLKTTVYSFPLSLQWRVVLECWAFLSREHERTRSVFWMGEFYASSTQHVGGVSVGGACGTGVYCTRVFLI